MIPLVEERKERFEEFRIYEECFFGCGTKTKYWHWKTNQPVCKYCARTHKVSELPKSHPEYKCKSKAEYLKAF